MADRVRGPVLRAAGVRKSFGGLDVLDGVSVTLHRGEVVVLRGDNGSGKTTFLNILTGCLQPDAGTIEFLADGTPERFQFPRHWWGNWNPFDRFAPERVASERFGRTWQDVRLFPTQDLLNNIALAMPSQLGENPFWALGRWRDVRRQESLNQARSAELLRNLDLGDRGTSLGDRISLGQSKRVAIARALRGGAEVLFLDEPLAGLDAEGVDQVLGMLRTLVLSHNITLVIVEHVLHVPRLLKMASTVWTLEGGRLRGESPDSVGDELAQGIEHNSGGRFLTSVRETGHVSEQPLGQGARLSVVRPASGQGDRPLLEVQDLVVHRDSRLVIGNSEGERTRGLSFTIREGEFSMLSAPNGWGKTTLLAAIAGLIPLTRGRVLFKGRDISLLPPWERSRLGLSFFQARDHVFPNLTVSEGLRLAGVSGVPAELASLAQRKMGSLSGGENQVAAIACAFRARTASLVLFDEPFSALDSVASSRLWTLLHGGSGLPTALIAFPALHE